MSSETPSNLAAQSWVRLSSRDIIRDRWIRLRADRCLLPSGKVVDPFYIMEEDEWVHVFAIDEQNRVCLVQQYRYPSNALGYEIPGGHCAPGEDLLACAQRELLEETGCVASSWKHVVGMSPGGRHNNRIHLFIADNAKVMAAQALDEHEEMSAHFFPPATVLELIRAHEINDTAMVSMIYTAFVELGWLTPSLHQA